MKKSSLLTTPIYYANGNPHIGHAYTSVLTDTINRHQKQSEKETFFLTGLDEHGQKIFEKSVEAGMSVFDFVEQYNISFKNLYSELSVDFDRFIRTTDKDHEEVVKLFWNKLVQNEDLYEKEYEGLYCIGCESFKTDRDLTDEGFCPDHQKKPVILKEKNWFFRLSKYSDYLREIIKTNKLKIIPEIRKEEMLEFINSGLQDISFSRSKDSVSWGIPVPNDSSQTIYVWCDALVNYITASQYSYDQEVFNKMWEEGNVLHIIGKDILKFHALYWPAMLKSVDISAPDEILVHGMITSGGIKMSKTIGNIIDPIEILKTYNEVLSKNSTLNNNLGAEFFRYFVLKNISPFSDGDITHERMKELYNADLSNGIGNLLSRTMRLCEKYLDKKDTFQQIEQPEEYKTAFENYDVKSAFEYIFRLVKEADQFMQEKEPFKVIKIDENLGKEYLEILREKIYTIARLLNPFMPETSKMIKEIVLSNKMPEKPLFPRYE